MLFHSVLAGSLFLLFYTLSPAAYRHSRYPKWPGALLVTVWWLVTTALLPVALSSLGSYDLTYGSLAGAMIALATDGIYMRNGAVMGAATPVDGGGTKAPEKIVSAMRSHMLDSVRADSDAPSWQSAFP